MRCLQIFLLLGLTGCVTRQIDRSHFDALTSRHGLGHVYHTGSKGEFHYLAAKYLWEPTKFYCMPVLAINLTNTFPKTCERERWIPWQVNLAAGTEGFPGEYIQELRK